MEQLGEPSRFFREPTQSYSVQASFVVKEAGTGDEGTHLVEVGSFTHKRGAVLLCRLAMAGLSSQLSINRISRSPRGVCPLLTQSVDCRAWCCRAMFGHGPCSRASFGRMLCFRATFGHCQRLWATFGRSSHLEWRNVARKRLRCLDSARKAHCVWILPESARGPERLRCPRTPAVSGTRSATRWLPFAPRCATRRFGRRCRESGRCPGGAAIRCARTYCPCYRRFGSS